MKTPDMKKKEVVVVCTDKVNNGIDTEKDEYWCLPGYIDYDCMEGLGINEYYIANKNDAYNKKSFRKPTPEELTWYNCNGAGILPGEIYNKSLLKLIDKSEYTYKITTRGIVKL